MVLPLRYSPGFVSRPGGAAFFLDITQHDLANNRLLAEPLYEHALMEQFPIPAGIGAVRLERRLIEFLAAGVDRACEQRDDHADGEERHESIGSGHLTKPLRNMG